MKKLSVSIALILFTFIAYSQKGISYQAVILDPNKIEIPGQDITGQPYINDNVWIKFAILSGVTTQFEEVQQTKTDAYGLVNLTIGSVASSSFNALIWDTNQKILQVYVSFDNGSLYKKVSDQKLSYIPYALFAETAGRLGSTLGIAGGGTGSTTVSGARTNLGLGNVDNTSDADKAISLATQAALNLKANASDLAAQLAVKADTIMLSTKAALSDLNKYAPIASPSFTGTVSGISKSMVGLSSVDNTSDAAKPISTAMQTALDLKLNADSNSASTTKLVSPRKINGVDFDGTSDITIPTIADAGTLSGTVSIAKGGTGATTAAAARTNLGLVIGINVQAPLTAGTDYLTPSGNAATATKLASAKKINGVDFDGSSDITVTAVASTLSGTVSVSKGGTGATTAAAARTNLGLRIGTDVQAILTAGTDYLTPTGSAAYLTNFPTLNQNTTGNAAMATLAGNITASSNSSLTTLSNLTSVGTLTSGTISLTTDIKTSGKLYAGDVSYPQTHGTAGQVLSTTGSGTLTWTSPSGVPYSGATGAVDLGGYDLVVNRITIGAGGGSILSNTALGFGSLSSNLTGTRNTAVGDEALKNNLDGDVNTSIGVASLYKNTSGSYNVAVGDGALYFNLSGYGNTALGVSSLLNSSSGNDNTAVGLSSLTNPHIAFITGSYNTGVGTNSLYNIGSGSYNTAIGYNANIANEAFSNSTAIGNGALANASNTVQLGNTSVVKVQTSGTLTTGSVTYPNTHGTNGQVLSTTGSGTLTWTTIAPSNRADASTLSGTIAIANGGTGATTAAAARTNLGLVIGTNVQAPLTAGTDYLTPTGNAATATKLATARNINGIAFDGSANITIAADASTLSGTISVAKGGTGTSTLSGLIIGNGSNAMSGLTGSVTGETLTWNSISSNWQLTGNSNLAIGNGAVGQGINAIAIGKNAGTNFQRANSLAFGNSAGAVYQGSDAIAIGSGAGFWTQGTNSITLGLNAGYQSQGDNSVALGPNSGKTYQGDNSIALGQNAGNSSQGTNSIALGANAGNLGQSNYSIAIGSDAGVNSQGLSSIAMGNSAGAISQGISSIAIGEGAGAERQGNGSIAIGSTAGFYDQGANAIAIGNQAGHPVQTANSIVINASGVALTNNSIQGLFIKPIRSNNISGGSLLQYNTTTSEIYSSNALTNATITEKVIVGSISETASSAVLEANSTTKGFLPPRMTNAERNTISSPNEGLMIWNTTESELNVYNGSLWINMAGVTNQTLSVGMKYLGGKVAYILQTGDPGYDSQIQHGIIAASSDQSNGALWSPTSSAIGTTINMGDGDLNTSKVINNIGSLSISNSAFSYAAAVAKRYRGGGYSDWYLPSKMELYWLFKNKDLIGGFNLSGINTDSWYWSSTEDDAQNAFIIPFAFSTNTTFNNLFFAEGKSFTFRVRAIRSF